MSSRPTPSRTELSGAEHNPTVCRASRHSRVQHLITADEASLPELEALLATLPICSTGRVFIEVPDESWCQPIRVPARMTATWLDRSRRGGAPGSGRGCAPGEALARAVSAWAAEMLCEPDEGTRVHLLGGFLGTADIVDVLTVHHAVPAASIHTPPRFGLSTSR